MVCFQRIFLLVFGWENGHVTDTSDAIELSDGAGWLRDLG